jgi:hypothetical protein
MMEPIEYMTTVQARDKKGRKTLELPRDVRDKFNAGDHVKVTVRKLK